jgi:hypothetical protein
MVGLILNILSRFFEPIKNLLIISRSSTKNFAIFIAAIAAINVLVRSVLVWTFSTPENFDFINKLTLLFVFTSCSVMFSVFIFHIRSNYPSFLRRIFCGLVDFARLDENKARREGLVRRLEIQFPGIRFDPQPFVYPIAIMWIIYSLKISPVWLHSILGWLIWIFAIFLIFYLRNIQKIVFQHAEIPTELFYIPSRPERLWWGLKFITWEALQGIFFGENRIRRSYTESEYYQRKLKTAKNYNTFARTLKGVLIFTTVLGSAMGIEAYFFQYPKISPSAQLSWRMVDGYYSDRAEVISAAFTLATYGCDMATFCYPETRRLDPSAVFAAYKELENSPRAWYEGGVYTTSKEPLPAGPYQKLSIVDGKESTDMPTSVITSNVEYKESPPIE